MKKKLIIILLVPVVELFYSCISCEDPCRDIVTKYGKFSHKELFLKNLDNSGEQIIETDALQINKNAYGIRLNLIIEKINGTVRLKAANSIFFQSAYALSYDCPPEYIYSAVDCIKSIKIFTLQDFDSQHSENSDITDYFKLSGLYEDVQDFSQTIGYTLEFDIIEYLDTPFHIDILLMTAPTIENQHQFKVQIELSDGRILEQETTKIELL